MCGLNNGATGSKNKHFCRKTKRFCNDLDSNFLLKYTCYKNYS